MCDQDTVRIPLLARNGSVRAYALVDAIDVELIGTVKWRLHSLGYAYRSLHEDGREVAILLHRVLMGLPSGRYGPEVDHINRDRLDNRRCNLRVVTHADNMQNRPSESSGSSKHRGVYWDRQKQRWMAAVQVNHKKVHLGQFKTELEAAEAAKAGRLRLMPFAID